MAVLDRENGDINGFLTKKSEDVDHNENLW